MGKNLFIGILLLVIGGLVCRNHSLEEKLHLSEERLNERLTVEAKARAAQNSLRQNLQEEVNLVRQQEMAAKAELETLFQQAQEQRAKVETLRQKIIELEGTKPPEGDLENQQRFTRGRELLSELEKKLTAVQAAQKELDRQARAAVNGEKTLSKAQTEQLTTQIRNQEEIVRNAQQDLNFWRKKNKDPNQNVRINEANEKLEQQRLVLQNLRLQKTVQGQNEKQQTEVINEEAGQQKLSLSDSQAQLQDQIRRAKDDLKDLQSQTAQAKKSTEDIKKRVEIANAEYRSELDKLKTFDDLYNRKKADLEKFVQTQRDLKK